MVREALARVDAQSPGNTAPGPTADDIAAAGVMSEKDRGDMIRNMVARLADRLKENGSDVEGWERLLRAYLVLGEREKAISAADAAKGRLPTTPTSSAVSRIRSRALDWKAKTE